MPSRKYATPSQSVVFLAEKRDAAQIDLDIITHIITLFQASKQQKEGTLAGIETEVSGAQV
jgi:hypothetical protein